MSIQWMFNHPDTGAMCAALWDGSMLVTEAVEAEPPEYSHHAPGTDVLLAVENLTALPCFSREVALRELKAAGVDWLQLEASEVVR